MDHIEMSLVKPLYRVLSEVCEKSTYNSLHYHMHTNNILIPEQFGFQKGIPTEDAAFKPTNRV
jgi:hypothetical protein